MNWYLFALFCEGLVALLMVFGMMFYTGCQTFLAKTKAEETEKMVYKICEKTIGRTIGTMEDSVKEVIDYTMENSIKMMEKAFNKAEDES